MLMDKLASTIVDHRTSGRYSHSHPNRGEFAKTQPPRKPGWFTPATLVRSSFGWFLIASGAAFAVYRLAS